MLKRILAGENLRVIFQEFSMRLTERHPIVIDIIKMVKGFLPIIWKGPGQNDAVVLQLGFVLPTEINFKIEDIASAFMRRGYTKTHDSPMKNGVPTKLEQNEFIVNITSQKAPGGYMVVVSIRMIELSADKENNRG